jgi:dihydrofolate reductase
MRKLKLITQLSLDGFVADAYEKTDWMTWNWGPDWRWDKELKRDFNTLHASIDSILLSRKMAEEGFIGHWTEVAKQAETEYEFARKITAASKVAAFVTSLIKTRMIDEYCLLINPTAIGKGMTIFNDIGDLLNLKPLQVKAYQCGMVALVYRS